MNIQVKDFYRDHQNKKVIALHENQDLPIGQVMEMAPRLPHGWFELMRLSSADRIEFVAAFWSSIFPYRPYVQDLIDHFFTQVEDIGVYLVKKDTDTHFFPHLVYSMEEGENFYYGFPSAVKEDLQRLKKALGVFLPEDYICFMKIHNGFARGGDYGFIPVQNIPGEMHSLHQKILTLGQKVQFYGTSADPKNFIPFYKSWGDSVFQCFHQGWYPDQEMGNILFSLRDEEGFCYTFSYEERKKVFSSFLDWLMSYMGKADV
jgi:hypothetical protein